MWAAPQEFELPRFVEGGWRIGRFDYAENPRYTVPNRLRQLVQRWAEMRRLTNRGMGAAVLLPCAGGYFDQPAAVMDAFELFDAWLAERGQGEGG